MVCLFMCVCLKMRLCCACEIGYRAVWCVLLLLCLCVVCYVVCAVLRVCLFFCVSVRCA